MAYVLKRTRWIALAVVSSCSLRENKMVVGIDFLIRVPFCVARFHTLIQLAVSRFALILLLRLAFSCTRKCSSCCSRCKPQVHETDSNCKLCFLRPVRESVLCLLGVWDGFKAFFHSHYVWSSDIIALSSCLAIEIKSFLYFVGLMFKLTPMPYLRPKLKILPRLSMPVTEGKTSIISQVRG